jgi:hypothetical protein
VNASRSLVGGQTPLIPPLSNLPPPALYVSVVAQILEAAILHRKGTEIRNSLFVLTLIRREHVRRLPHKRLRRVP